MEREKVLTKGQWTSHYKQIRDIIIVSAQLGVSELKFGDLSVRFGPESQTLAYGLTENQDQKKTHPKKPSPPESAEPRLSKADQELLDDMHRAQMMIEDPLSYENELIAGALAEGTEHAGASEH